MSYKSGFSFRPLQLRSGRLIAMHENAERKVRATQGAILPNRKGAGGKRLFTDSATENIPSRPHGAG